MLQRIKSIMKALSLPGTYEELVRENEQLLKEVSAARQEARWEVANNTARKNDLDSTLKVNAELEFKLDEANGKLAVEEQKSNGLARNLVSYKEKSENAAKDMLHYTEKCERLNASLTNLETARKTLHQQVHDISANLATVEGQRDKAVEKAYEYRQKWQQSAECHVAACEREKKLAAERIAEQHECQRLAGKLSTVTEERDQILAQLRDANNRFDALSKQVEATGNLELRCKELREEIRATREALQTTQSRSLTLSHKCDEYAKELRFAKECKDAMAAERDDANKKLLNLDAELKRLQAIEADLIEASGELMIPLPEPGTDIAKLCHANIMMRKYRIPSLEERIDELQRKNEFWENFRKGMRFSGMDLRRGPRKPRRDEWKYIITVLGWFLERRKQDCSCGRCNKCTYGQDAIEKAIKIATRHLNNLERELGETSEPAAPPKQGMLALADQSQNVA